MTLAQALAQLSGKSEPNSQFDYPVNSASGFQPNTYGTLTAFADVPSCFSGNMAIYLPSKVGEEGIRGTVINLDGWRNGECITPFNSFNPSRDPSDSNSPTLHWLQISNGPVQTSFTAIVYGLTGAELTQTTVTLDSYQRFDLNLAAGAENNYGYLRLIPDNTTSTFSAYLYRYGQDTTTLAGERSAAFTIADACTIASTRSRLMPVSKGGSAVNWLELTNISTQEAVATVRYYSNKIGLLEELPLTLAGGSTIHIDGTKGFSEGESGWIEVEPATTSPILSKSSSYYFRDDGKVSTAAAVSGRSLFTTQASGVFNSFLSQSNWLRLYNFSASPVSISLNAVNGNGGEQLSNSTLLLDANSGQDIHINSNLAIPVNRYGELSIQVEPAAQVAAELLRVQYSSDGKVIETEPAGVSGQ